MLPNEPLERAACSRSCRLARPACAACCTACGLRLQLVERQDELTQRVKQRQAYEQEGQQNEFEEERG